MGTGVALNIHVFSVFPMLGKATGAAFFWFLSVNPYGVPKKKKAARFIQVLKRDWSENCQV